MQQKNKNNLKNKLLINITSSKGGQNVRVKTPILEALRGISLEEKRSITEVANDALMQYVIKKYDS